MPREREVKPLMALADQGVQGDLGAFVQWSEAEHSADRKLNGEFRRLLDEYPGSEVAWMRWLSQQIPREARLFLGNSLPIREWDSAAEIDAACDVFANRGTNGIDGLVSTFAGVADVHRSNWAVIGDLSALYDQCGLWALRERPVKDFNLVVINNSGGQIFHRLFRDRMFLNTHDLRFSAWASMWGLKYQLLQKPEALSAAKDPRLLEILPDNSQTESFWTAWEKI